MPWTTDSRYTKPTSDLSPQTIAGFAFCELEDLIADMRSLATGVEPWSPEMAKAMCDTADDYEETLADMRRVLYGT